MNGIEINPKEVIFIRTYQFDLNAITEEGPVSDLHILRTYQ